MAIQAALGSDIAMAFDECPPSDAPRAVDRGGDGAHDPLGAPLPGGAPRRPGSCASASCRAARTSTCGARHLAEIAALPFDGLALGGLGVGEAPEVMYEVIDAIAAEMPADRPRYLMGVGTPEDIWTAIGAGVDMFDCVMPTRNARNGQLFMRGGRSTSRNAQHRDDPRPVEEGCPLRVLRAYSRAYLAHLFHAKELLYYRLASIHNLAALPEPCPASARGDRRRRFRPPGSPAYPVVAARGRRARGKRPTMAKRVGVILSGCGRRDGSDVAEAMLALLVLERAGAEAVCAAPDVDHAGRRRPPEPARPGRAAQRASRVGTHHRRPVLSARRADPADASTGSIIPGGEGAS